jgi:hypothetical protein
MEIDGELSSTREEPHPSNVSQAETGGARACANATYLGLERPIPEGKGRGLA